MRRAVSALLLLLCTSPLLAAQSPRLVVLAPHLVEQLYSIGAGGMIVGTVEHADYPLAAAAIPRIGNYAGLQLESILALKPDLVLFWQSGSPAAEISQLQRLGIRTAGFEPKTLDDIATDLERLGSLTGHQAQAKPTGFAAVRDLAWPHCASNISRKKPCGYFMNYGTSRCRQ